MRSRDDAPTPSDLEGRIRAYARYFALIQQQHEAFDSDDLDRVISLADERKRLEAGLPEPTDLAASADPKVQDLVGQLRSHLVEGFRSHRALVEKMKAARVDLGQAIVGMETRATAAHAYIREDASETRKRLDFRF